MTSLIPYDPSCREALLPMIVDLFDYHRNLIAFGTKAMGKAAGPDEAARALKEAGQTLERWQKEGLALIRYGETLAGFAQMAPRGGPVVWLEDLYVLPALRGKGIGSAAVGLCEEYAREVLKAPALCIDVATRNMDAMRLYHKLGFDSMSLVTLRKELSGDNPRTEATEFKGMTFFT